MNTVLIKENETFDFKPFSIAIKQARLKAGLTIEQLAESTGVTARYISAIENEGKRTSIKTLITIAKHLIFPLMKLFILITQIKIQQEDY